MASRSLYGRKPIYTDVEEITSQNVCEVLDDLMPTQQTNSNDIDYLYNYYKGNQDILNRIKDVRPEINNLIVVNRAKEIVDFKTGYLIGSPIVYTPRIADEKISEGVNLLNDYMVSEDKYSEDTNLINWIHICGVGYRLILADKIGEEDQAPFEIYTLDPRSTFVIRKNDITKKPLAGVTYVTLTDGSTVVYTVYTATEVFKIQDGKIIERDTHLLGNIPIVEYIGNDARMGAFEPCISLLDAINLCESDRQNAIAQFVQALMVFKNVDINNETFAGLREYGAVSIPGDADIKYIADELSQTQTQTLVDDMYDSVLTICGMPARSGSGAASTSDNGVAVMLRNGWSNAEAVAKTTEAMFKRSEKDLLKLVVNIVNSAPGNEISELKQSDIDIHFSRRNYENIQEKSQVLITLLNNPKVHPLLAFQYSGMFPDPDEAYLMSKEYWEAEEEKMLQSLNEVPVSSYRKQKDTGEEYTVSGYTRGEYGNAVNVEDTTEDS